MLNLVRATAADGVVKAAAIGDDGEQRPAAVGVQHRAGAEKDAAADLHGIGGAVAILRMVRVVAQEIDPLFTLEVDEAHHLALRDHPAPGLARRDDRVLDDAARSDIECIGHVQEPFPM